MQSEASLFETSEMLATFMASTPVLAEAWRLCRVAYNTMAPLGFAVEQVGEVSYIAFSGIVPQSAVVCEGFTDSNGNDNLVPIDHTARLFSPLCGYGDDDEADPPMVHAEFLNLFLSLYHSNGFQSQVVSILEKSKAVIITGHSVGATTASLATLWLLSYLHSISSSLSILCITFGSPLLGNYSLSKAIHRERWAGKFCHLVSKNDIVPRLFFAPILPSIVPHLNHLLQLWLISMTSLPLKPDQYLSDHDLPELHHYVLAHIAEAATKTHEDMSSKSSSTVYMPFGSYLFCSDKGAICLDNVKAIVKMLHLMFLHGSANSSFDEHVHYGEVVMKMAHSQEFLKQKCFSHGHSKSSYEVGISLALETLGMPNPDSLLLGQARECLRMARQTGRTPNLNSANLAIRLAKVTPYRAQIEWFKACCDESDDQLGYYDTFKLGGASKRNSKVNMNRIKLANFWDDVIHMLETNQLPYDFQERAKWVNASQFYKLLVEPLDIAYYYRSGMHRSKGHYLSHGRERRYEIFDRWWTGRSSNVCEEEESSKKRSKNAGLTQDSCFWARLEEAKEWLENAGRESEAGKLAQIWDKIENFEVYARRLVDSKEVSKDVEARNSSYSLWLEDLKELKLQLQRSPLQFPGVLGSQMVP